MKDKEELELFFKNLISDAMASTFFIIIKSRVESLLNSDMIEHMLNKPVEVYDALIKVFGSEKGLISADNVLVQYLRDYDIRIYGIFKLLKEGKVSQLIIVAKKYNKRRKLMLLLNNRKIWADYQEDRT